MLEKSRQAGVEVLTSQPHGVLGFHSLLLFAIDADGIEGPGRRSVWNSLYSTEYGTQMSHSANCDICFLET